MGGRAAGGNGRDRLKRAMFHPDGPTFFELARQALSSTEYGYDLLAPKFDLTPFRTPTELLADAAPLIAPPAGLESALDLCCGTGAGLETLRPLCRRRVVGVDFSRGMLEVAQQRLSPQRAEVELVRRDVLEIDYEAEFDAVVCFSAIGHIRGRDQPRFLAAAARALKPGGRFVTITADWPPPWSPGLAFALFFNAAMAMRNVIRRPPFVMYYLNFMLPRARRLLLAQGLEPEVHRAYCASFPRFHLLTARRRRL